jgi:hypothetical protein
MFGGFFGWLRRTARDATLAGVQDALDELDPQTGSEQQPVRLDRIRALAATEARALPAGEDEAPGGKRRGK